MNMRRELLGLTCKNCANLEAGEFTSLFRMPLQTPGGFRPLFGSALGFGACLKASWPRCKHLRERPSMRRRNESARGNRAARLLNPGDGERGNRPRMNGKTW